MSDQRPPSPFDHPEPAPAPALVEETRVLEPVNAREPKRSRLRPVGNFLWAVGVVAAGTGAGVGGVLHFAPKEEPAPVVEPEIRTVIESPRECLGLGLAVGQLQSSAAELAGVVGEYSKLIRPTFKAGQANDKARGAQILAKQDALNRQKATAMQTVKEADVTVCLDAIAKTQPKPDSATTGDDPASVTTPEVG